MRFGTVVWKPDKEKGFLRKLNLLQKHIISLIADLAQSQEWKTLLQSQLPVPIQKWVKGVANEQG